MELLRITRQIHCKAVEQRATLIHRQYNRDWGTSYSKPPIDQYLTSPCYKILAAPLLRGTSCTTNPQQIEIEWSYSITVGANENTCVRPRRVDCRKCGQQARPSTSFVDNTVDMPLQRKVQSLGQSSSRPGSVLIFASTRNLCRLCRRALQPRLRKFNQHYK